MTAADRLIAMQEAAQAEAWSNVTDPPKDGRTVILVTPQGKATISRWLAPSKKDRRPIGRWQFFQPGEAPLAWMPWPEWKP